MKMQIKSHSTFQKEQLVNKENGITLVALVVTIVVLLILAGITINLILGQNSIFDMARKAGEETNNAVEDEQTGMNKLIEKLEGGNWGNSGNGTTNNENTTVKISEISFPLSTVGVAIDGSITLRPNIEPANASNKTLNWISENPDIVTVDENGAVTPIKLGEATIKVESTDGSEKTTTCKVTVIEEGAIPYSWEELNEIAEAISNNTSYDEDTENISVTVYGETKTLKVGDWTRLEGKKVRILGFNHDELTNPTAYGEETETGKAGISFEFTEFLDETYVMNSDDYNTNGWGGNPFGTNASDMRTYLNGTETGLEATIGGEATNLTSIQNYIKRVKKPYLLGNGSETVLYSDDWLWLLSCSEIWTNGKSGARYGYAKAKEGEQYKYYKKLSPDGSSNATNTGLRKTAGGTAYTWWLRSPSYNSARNFSYVYSARL